MSYPDALSQLLHRALEPRLSHLLELCASEGWQEDPEALHQVRIASRRVRAVLDLVDPDLYPGFRRQERHLRRLTRALGLTRELDVHAETLGTLKEVAVDPFHHACLEFLLEGLDRKRRKARSTMYQDLERVTLKDLDRLLTPPSPREPPEVADMAAAVWSCLESRLRSVDEPIPNLQSQEDIRGLHELRIQVKRLRYTLEILEPAFPNSLEPILQQLKSLQTELGQHHDHATLEAHLWKIHTALTSRQHTTLASGILDLIGLVAEERRTRYERFCTLGQEHRDSVPFFHLKKALEASPGAAG